MRTKAILSNVATRWRCPLCGGLTGKHNFAMQLLDDDGNMIADTICERCIEAGPDAVAERMRAYADELTKRAQEVRTLAAGVAAIQGADWATLDDAIALENECYGKMPF